MQPRNEHDLAGATAPGATRHGADEEPAEGDGDGGLESPWKPYLRFAAMIPHHSLAITRAERFDVDDARVCELAVEISEAQRREILQMDWLIDDINENGAASTRAEAEARPVPQFDVSADLVCDPD